MSICARNIAAMLALAILAAASGVAAQPANDDFANATLMVGLPAVAAGANSILATKEIGEPDHEDDFGSTESGGFSVWWTWTAPTTEPVIVDLCGTNFPSLLSVYTGAAVNALTRVPDVDRADCNGRPSFSFDAVSGTTYHIAVDGETIFSVPRTGSIVLGIRRLAPNDDFVDATEIVGSTALVMGHNLLTSKETGEPDHSGSLASFRSVWWEWTAPSSGPVRVSTCDSSTDDTFLGVYTGVAVNALVQVAQNDDFCSQRAALTFTAAAGTTYAIAVDSDESDPELVLRLGPPPANDDFANAAILTTASTEMGVNALATTESGEPVGVLAGSSTTPGSRNTLWWQWTAPSTGPFTIDTCESDFDTVLGIYTGTQVDALVEVARSDDGCGAQSQVTFDAVASTVYHVQVGGYFNLLIEDDTAEIIPATGHCRSPCRRWGGSAADRPAWAGRLHGVAVEPDRQARRVYDAGDRDRRRR